MFRPPWRLFVEWISSGEACFREVVEFIASSSVGGQAVDVVVLSGLGKALVMDGKVQSSLYDEYWYHEALVHPAMLLHPCPCRVLVVGGGEGATLREVLRHPTVSRAVMVDIEPSMIEMAERLLAEWHQGSFRHAYVDVVAADGRGFVEAVRPGCFDVVILDLVDPLEGGPAVYLYTLEFYRAVYRALSGNGVVVTQATSPVLHPRVFAAIYHTMARVFPHVAAYTVYMRSYNGLWGFVIASKTEDPSCLMGRVDELLRERGVRGLRFYDDETHRWMFSLPRPVRRVLEEYRVVSTDKEPVSIPF
ncbi:MAG: spermidine synthase [Crenarchaeota archaeon]|nr:spermidine synthase [Thermoproteota archaeon]